MQSRRIVFINLFLIIAATLSYCTDRSKSTNAEGKKSASLGTAPGGSGNLNLDEPSKIPGTIDEIKILYSAIKVKADKGVLDSTSFDYSCNGEKRGRVSYFSENGKLKMVVHRYNEYDHYDAVDRYFVKDSTLFFVYRNSTSWGFESGIEGATKDNITEHRVYLVNEQPVKCLEKKFVTRSHASNNPRSEEVPNKEVDCTLVKSGLQMYKRLISYRGKATPGCIDSEGA